LLTLACQTSRERKNVARKKKMRMRCAPGPQPRSKPELPPVPPRTVGTLKSYRAPSHYRCRRRCRGCCNLPEVCGLPSLTVRAAENTNFTREVTQIDHQYADFGPFTAHQLTPTKGSPLRRSHAPNPRVRVLDDLQAPPFPRYRGCAITFGPWNEQRVPMRTVARFPKIQASSILPSIQ
jgi:hypothetical protein